MEQAERSGDPKLLLEFLRRKEIEQVKEGTRADRAILALRVCAEALEQMPIRRRNVFLGNTPILGTQAMRDEADWIERQRNAWQAVIVDEEPVPPSGDD